MEQVSGKVIAKGPKVGRLFPLQFISSHLSLACNNVLNSYEDWHRKLGHPNSTILSQPVTEPRNMHQPVTKRQVSGHPAQSSSVSC